MIFIHFKLYLCLLRQQSTALVCYNSPSPSLSLCVPLSSPYHLFVKLLLLFCVSKLNIIQNQLKKLNLKNLKDGNSPKNCHKMKNDLPFCCPSFLHPPPIFVIKFPKMFFSIQEKLTSISSDEVLMLAKLLINHNFAMIYKPAAWKIAGNLISDRKSNHL